MANDDAFRQAPADNPYYAPQAAPAEAGGYITRSELTLNPWTSIWTRPRATIRQIVDTDPKYMVIPLGAAAGIAQALGEISDRPQNDELPLQMIMAIAIGVGAVLGLAGLFVGGWVIRWTASWLGGVGTSLQTRAAWAWGQVPVVATIPIMLTLIALFGLDVFNNYSPETELQAQLWPLILVGGGLVVVLSVWSVFTLLKCVAEVHQFSSWRSLGAFFLASLVVFAVVFVPIILFGIVAGIAVGFR